MNLMKRKRSFEIGEIVQKECGYCGVVRHMRYDGFAFNDDVFEILENNLNPPKPDEIERLANLGSYTCQECFITFSYPNEISDYMLCM